MVAPESDRNNDWLMGWFDLLPIWQLFFFRSARLCFTENDFFAYRPISRNELMMLNEGHLFNFWDACSGCINRRNMT